MALPVLAPADIVAMVPGIQVVGARRAGGQKLVFPCSLGNEKFALIIRSCLGPR